MKHFGRYFLRILPFFYAAFIWWQSSQFDPELVYTLRTTLGTTLVTILGASLELAHLFEFALLYVFITLAILTFGHKLTKDVEFIVFYISLWYGLADEIHQSFVPFRSASTIDLFKDIVGILVAWFVIHRFYYKPQSKLGAKLRKITLISANKSERL